MNIKNIMLSEEVRHKSIYAALFYLEDVEGQAELTQCATIKNSLYALLLHIKQKNNKDML